MSIVHLFEVKVKTHREHIQNTLSLNDWQLHSAMSCCLTSVERKKKLLLIVHHYNLLRKSFTYIIILFVALRGFLFVQLVCNQIVGFCI